MESYQTKDVVLTAEYYQAQEIMENITKMEMDDPIAFAPNHDPDTMYFHQAVKQPDAQQFVWAMKLKRDIKTSQDNQLQSQAKCA
eukprot:15331928-Ditylum_brightwellii.AAC.1